MHPSLKTTHSCFRQDTRSIYLVFANQFLKFITEDGSGKRARRSSADLHAIRSQARKYGVLERQRQHAASQKPLKDDHRILQRASDKTHAHPLMPTPDATWCSPHTSWVDSSDVGSSNQETDPQILSQMGNLLVEVQGAQAKYRPVIRARPAKFHEASGKHALQRQALQRMGPQTNLGGGKADPFESYPIKGQPYAHMLMDHCKSLHFVLLQLRKFPDRQAANLL
jgi:hypothetical protein